MKYIIIFLTILMFSCKKQDTSPTIPPIVENPECCAYSGKLDVLWEIPLDKDTLGSISTEPIIVNDKVIFTLWPKDHPDPELVTAYDLQTGDIQWEWESISTGHTNTRNSIFTYQDNLLYRAGQKDICLLDGNSADLIWSYNPYDDGIRGYANSKVIDDYYYREHHPPGTVSQTSTLIRGNMETGEIENILTKNIKDGFSPRLVAPSIWVNQNGETIFLIKKNSYNWDTNESSGDLIMFDNESKEEIYVWEGIFGRGSASISYIWNDNIYLHANDSIKCINLISKETLWQSYIGGTNSCNFFVEKGVLIANPIDKKLFGFNPHTGETIWESSDSGSNCSTMAYFDGIVYFGSLGRGRLYAVDIETGEHIWAESPPNRETGEYPGAAFLNGVAIDTVNRVLYTDDEYFVMGIKLPER